jgi:hypothetical protein
MDYNGLIRRKILEELYEKMSDDEKRLFVQLTMQNKTGDEILQALAQQKAQLERIEKSQNWVVDFGSDIAANLLTDSLIWLGGKLFRKL